MRKALIVGIPVVVVLAAAGFAGWWFVLRGDAPPAIEGVAEQFGASPTTESDETGASEAASTTGGAASTATAPPTTAAQTADGTWTIRPAREVFVGYRIDEKVAGVGAFHPAVGRSRAVSGTITFGGTSVSAANVEVDMTQLVSDESRRDARLRTGGLETDTFPVATFTLTQPIDLGGAPQAGQVLNVTATGDLTLHGVTRSVQLPIQARWSGETVEVTGSTTIVLADYGISMEAFAGVVSVAPEGTLEVALQFVRS